MLFQMQNQATQFKNCILQHKNCYGTTVNTVISVGVVPSSLHREKHIFKVGMALYILLTPQLTD